MENNAKTTDATFLDSLVKKSEALESRASELFNQLDNISARLFSEHPTEEGKNTPTVTPSGKLYKIEYSLTSLAQKMEAIGGVLAQLDSKI